MRFRINRLRNLAAVMILPVVFGCTATETTETTDPTTDTGTDTGTTDTGTEELDCAGVAGGTATVDDCGVCDDDASNDNSTCEEDCAGNWGGTAYVDDCGVCNDNAGDDNTACEQDCAGTWDGAAYVDDCGVCNEDAADDNTACEQDCAGVWDGQAMLDDCGTCDLDVANDCTPNVMAALNADLFFEDISWVLVNMEDGTEIDNGVPDMSGVDHRNYELDDGVYCFNVDDYYGDGGLEGIVDVATGLVVVEEPADDTTDDTTDDSTDDTTDDSTDTTDDSTDTTDDSTDTTDDSTDTTDDSTDTTDDSTDTTDDVTEDSADPGYVFAESNTWWSIDYLKSGQFCFEVMTACWVAEGPDAYYDGCGTCDADSDNDCTPDCNDEWGGTAVADQCGVCDDDPENDCQPTAVIVTNSDTYPGESSWELVDANGETVESGSPSASNTEDEYGIFLDDGRYCLTVTDSYGDGGMSASLTVGGAALFSVDGSNSYSEETFCFTVGYDCAGVDGGNSAEDMCGVCDEDPANDCVADCSGEWGGSATVDDCGTCDADAANDCVVSSSSVTATLTPASYPSEISWSLTNEATGDVVDSRALGDVSAEEVLIYELTAAEYCFRVDDKWADGGLGGSVTIEDAAEPALTWASSDYTGAGSGWMDGSGETGVFCFEVIAAGAPDCAGVADGPNMVDECGVCDDDQTNDCVQDCAGTWDGAALEDGCGTCDDDSSNDCTPNVEYVLTADAAFEEISWTLYGSEGDTLVEVRSGTPSGADAVDTYSAELEDGTYCFVVSDTKSSWWVEGDGGLAGSVTYNGAEAVAWAADAYTNIGQFCFLVGEDCAGVDGGDSTLDGCGTCDADPENDCVEDCAGTWGGTAIADQCGGCDEDSTNDCQPNATVTLISDGYKSESSWSLTLEGELVAEGVPAESNATEEVLAELVDGYYCLDAYDSYGDGGFEVTVAMGGTVLATAGGAFDWDYQSTSCFRVGPDCEGTDAGEAVEDNCGTCDADPENDCRMDCEGTWGGTVLDCGNAWVLMQCAAENEDYRWRVLSMNEDTGEYPIVEAGGYAGQVDVTMGWTLESGAYAFALYHDDIAGEGDGQYPECDSDADCGDDQFCSVECFEGDCGEWGDVPAGTMGQYCQPCAQCEVDSDAVSGSCEACGGATGETEDDAADDNTDDAANDAADDTADSSEEPMPEPEPMGRCVGTLLVDGLHITSWDVDAYANDHWYGFSFEIPEVVVEEPETGDDTDTDTDGTDDGDTDGNTDGNTDGTDG